MNALSVHILCEDRNQFLKLKVKIFIKNLVYNKKKETYHNTYE